MKINRFETHDRLKHLKEDQGDNVFKGAEDCLKKNPLSIALQEKSPYIYMYAHPRTAQDGVTKAMYWQPRLSKPSPQTNSYLFRAISKTDIVEVCWLIPPREQWPEYNLGKVTENELVVWSVKQFQYNRKELEKPHEHDITEIAAQEILKQVIVEHKQKIEMDKIMLTTSEDSSL